MPETTEPVIRRAAERFCTRIETDGKETWHSFSFGNHYDPSRISFGPIMAINEERLAPGAGYEPHKHREVDILTWVLNGTLAHEDSTGFGGDVTPGTLQHLNAGPGVTHSETNGSNTAPSSGVTFPLLWTHTFCCGMTTNSAKAPSRCTPTLDVLMHSWRRPARQFRHSPHTT